MDTPNPTGAEQFNRTIKMKRMVLDILTDYPPTRGDDTQLYIRVLQRYYWKLVEVRTKPTITLRFRDYDALMRCPAPESCRRRRQEIFEDLKHQIERGEITGSVLLPTERVMKKRVRAERAYRHGMSGQLSISDYSLEK